MNNFFNTTDAVAGDVCKNSISGDIMAISGKFVAQCFDKDGNLKWEDGIINTVTDEGKKFALDALFGATFSSVYMGLISSVGWSAINGVTDNAAGINGANGWKEAGSGSNFPIFANRGTPSFSSAAKATTVDKSTSSAVSFSIITTGGTLKGAIIVINGTSAIGNTTGKLYSAGLFQGGDKVVAVSDTINVSYTTSIS